LKNISIKKLFNTLSDLEKQDFKANF